MDLGPTPEQLKHDEYEPPHRSQRTNRTAHRRKAWFESIRNLEWEHGEAAKKLEKHYLGSLGHDVRDHDAISDGFCSSYEVPQTWYASQLEHARQHVGPRAWAALMAQIDANPDRRINATTIGQWWGGYSNRPQAKAWGDALLLSGLDQLVMHYGLIRRPDG